MKRVIFLPWLAVLLAGCAPKPSAQDTFVNLGNPLIRDCYTADPAPMIASDGRLYLLRGHDE